MIDKIEIILNDDGKFEVNVGDVHLYIAHNVGEVIGLVNIYVKKLGYFPQNHNDMMNANPLPYEYFHAKNTKKGNKLESPQA